MVSESMHIRFYAGVPLIGANGDVFGTLCVMDIKKREYDETAIAIHKSVARQVADHVEIELKNDELLNGLEARENGLRSIVNRLKTPLENLANLSDDLDTIVKENANLEFDDKVALLALYAGSARGIVSNIDAEAVGLTYSLQPEVDKIFEMFSVEAKAKNIKLSSKIAKNIEVDMDGGVMATLLRKTIFNGIRFCLNGGGVNVEAWKTAQYVLVSVSDSGVGIGPDKLQNILNDSIDSSGPVFGLSMCRRLLEASNGHLDIISETGMGTTVSMSFPC